MLLKDTIIEGLLDGKASDVVCLDMRDIEGSVCDYFVIGHGDSATHIEGINRAVYKKCIKELKEKPVEEVPVEPPVIPAKISWADMMDEEDEEDLEVLY